MLSTRPPFLSSPEAVSEPFLPSLCTALGQVDLNERNPHEDKELQKDTLVRWLDNNGHSAAASQLLDCGNSYAHLKCSKGHEKVTRIYCDNEFCPTCGQIDSRAHKTRSTRGYDRLLWAPILGYYVFTLPADIGASHLTREQLNILGKKAYKIVENILKIDGAMCRTHFAGKKLGHLQIHFNVLFPLLGTNGLGVITAGARDSIRQAWTAFINEFFSLSLKETDVSYSFAPTQVKKINKIKYVLRPIVDAFMFMTLSDEDKAYVMSLRKWHNTRWFGKLSNALYKKYLIEKGVDPVKFERDDPYLSNVCPVCGTRFRFVEILRKADILWQRFRRIDRDVAVDLEVFAALKTKAAAC